jgi:Flp pilus assembly protein TadD
VARDASVSETIVCQKCRSKVAAIRHSCPRCGLRFAVSDPEREAAKSKRLALISGTALVLALIGLGVVYMQQPVETESAAAGTPVADPLAARRAASSAAVAAAQAADAAPADPSARAEANYASGDGARLIDQYRDAVQRRPEDADAHASLAQMLERLKRTDEAVPEFERAVALAPQNATHHLNLGKALAELQRWPDAVQSLRRAQQLQPSDAGTASELGRVLNKNGDHAAAVEAYRKVIGLDPNDAPARMALAETFEAMDRRQDAAAAYNEYLKMAPAGTDADRVRLKLSRLSGQPAAPAAAQPGGTE